MGLPLLSLSVAAFGIGMTEFIIMGLLPQLAADLQVTIPQAGFLVSGYALGVVVGAPIMAVATARAPRRPVLIALMGLFVLGNIACALAADYGWLMAARVLTAFAHAAFFGLGAVVATQVVPAGRQARAIALMFMGLTLANVLGVPIGTAIGQVTGWRSTFWGVGMIGALAMLALHLWLPRDLPRGAGGIMAEFRAMARPQVQLAMLISVLTSAAMFAIFTYIAPMLEHVTGITGQGISAVLLVVGLGMTAGNLLGGRLGDWKLMPMVIALLLAAAGVMVVMSGVLTNPMAAVAAILAWAVANSSIGTPMQMRVIQMAPGAPTLASTVNQGAFNLGNAGGAWISGVALTYGASYATLPLIAACIALAAAALAALSHSIERRALRVAAFPAPAE
ncbi:MFS transporter [Roseomonas chloroacetimidivorans]|uniref:MFS transporter n=1 Tax=Roseomonas chloroacetimidivorans TaxID=1766656 RepID=UPI003C749BD1